MQSDKSLQDDELKKLLMSSLSTKKKNKKKKKASEQWLFSVATVLIGGNTVCPFCRQSLMIRKRRKMTDMQGRAFTYMVANPTVMYSRGSPYMGLYIISNYTYNCMQRPPV